MELSGCLKHYLKCAASLAGVAAYAPQTEQRTLSSPPGEALLLPLQHSKVSTNNSLPQHAVQEDLDSSRVAHLLKNSSRRALSTGGTQAKVWVLP